MLKQDVKPARGPTVNKNSHGKITRMASRFRRFTRCALSILASILVADVCGAQEPVVEWQLENGMQCILKPLPQGQRTCLLIVFSIGNLDDPAGQSGMAHLAEHVYVSAATSLKPARTKQELFREYPDGWKGVTGDDYTLVSKVFRPEELELELQDAGQRMVRVEVTEADVLRELPQIENELELLESSGPLVMARTLGIAHRRPLPHSGRRGGVKEEMKSIGVGKVQNWSDNFFKPANAVLVVAGPLDVEETKSKIDTVFGPIGPGETPLRNESPTPDYEQPLTASFDASEDDSDRVLALTYAAPLPSDPQYVAFLMQMARLHVELQDPRKSLPNLGISFSPLETPEFVTLIQRTPPNQDPHEDLRVLGEFLTEQLALPTDRRHVQAFGQLFGSELGFRAIPDQAWTSNPFKLAYWLARRKQVALPDAEAFASALSALTEEQLAEVAVQFFDKSNRADVILDPKPAGQDDGR